MTGQGGAPNKQPLFFRIIAFIARLQPGYLIRTMSNPQIVVIMTSVIGGAITIGIISIAAFITNLSLVFPPLAATTFIVFYTPMGKSACPRNIITAHTLGIIIGLSSLMLSAWLFPDSNVQDPEVMNWTSISTVAFSIGIFSALMIIFNCVHPPAAATALIAVLGYITNSTQVIGFIGAAILLVLNTFLFHRVIGGLPYPIWRYKPDVAQEHKVLAGLNDSDTPLWEQISARIFQRR